LLAVGLGLNGSGGAELVSECFAKVYEAAKKNAIAAPLWQRLEHVLPWFSPSWDKSGRLIRAAARTFVEQSWPLSGFCKTFPTADLLTRAVGEVQRMWGGSRYLRQLKSGALNRSIGATPEQTAILARLDIV
jgi:hypothetical protein